MSGSRCSTWILVVFAGLALLGGWVSLRAVATYRDLERSSRDVRVKNVASLMAAAELSTTLMEQRGLVAVYLLRPEARWLDELEVARARFAVELADAERAAFTAAEVDILTELRAAYREHDALRAELLRVLSAGDLPAAVTLYAERVKPVGASVVAACARLVAVNHEQMNAIEHENREAVARMDRAVWMAVLVAVSVGGLIGGLLCFSILPRLLRRERLAQLGQAAGVLAHEIRNPLAAMRMLLHAVRERNGTATRSPGDLDMLEEEVDRLQRTVDRHLNLLRSTPLRRQPLDVGELVIRAVEASRPVLEDRGVACAVHLDPALAPIEADGDLLHQALSNLLLNAAQATPSGASVEVVAGPAQDRRGADAVRIAVRDRGPGVDRRLRRRLFEPLVSGRRDGLGLGLYQARHAAKLHGGTVVLESSNGDGSTFAMTIPVRASTAGAA